MKRQKEQKSHLKRNLAAVIFFFNMSQYQSTFVKTFPHRHPFVECLYFKRKTWKALEKSLDFFFLYFLTSILFQI